MVSRVRWGLSLAPALAALAAAAVLSAQLDRGTADGPLEAASAASAVPPALRPGGHAGFGEQGEP